MKVGFFYYGWSVIMPNRDFGARLRELRQQASLSQRELADSIGINFTYLSKIESGVMPPPSEKVILGLAEALNVDKDELLVLAGKIPADIAQILKNREALQFLRSDRTQKKIGTANRKRGINVMKNLLSYKSLARVAIPIVLVFTIAASLWYASPTPVRALNITITPPASGQYLGGTHSFTITVDIANADLVPIQSADLEIYNVLDPTNYKVTASNLPKSDGGAANYVCSSGSVVSVTVSAPNISDYLYGTGYAYWMGAGYQFGSGYGYGYGYATGSGTITYTGTWTSPESWPTGEYKVRLSLAASSPTLSKTFTKTSSSFTLNSGLVTGGGGGGGAPPAPAPAPSPVVVVEPGVVDVSAVVDDQGVFTGDVTTESDDGNVELAVDKDTVGKTAEGDPVSEIGVTEVATPAPAAGAWGGLESTVNTAADTVSTSLDSFSKYAVVVQNQVVGSTYELEPSGATFDPPITVTFDYDPADIPEGISEEDLVISRWEEKEVVAPPVVEPPVVEPPVVEPPVVEPPVVEPPVVEPPVVEPPVVEPPVEEPAQPVNWGLIGGIIAAVIVIGLLVYFLWWRRRTA